MNRKKIKGDLGEGLVCDYLRDKGYIIVARNYKTRMGEIDIIAQNRDTVAFVEVKARKKTSNYLPREAVDKSKQHRIASAAGEYIARTQNALTVRFDVAEVIFFGDNKESAKINYIENAFLPEDMYWI